MGNPLFWGKLVIAGAGGTPVLYFGLMDVTSHKNREYKIEVDLGEGDKELAKTQDSLSTFSFSNRIYQGIERGTRCFIKSWQPEEIYRVVMKFGDAKGYFSRGDWGLSGVLGVRTVNLKFETDQEVPGQGQFGGLYERDDNNLDKYGIAVYKSKSGGGILLFEKGTPVGQRTPKEEKVTDTEIKKVKEELIGKKIKVRRSVVSAWSRMEGSGCKVTSVKDGEPIYRNYGMLQVNGTPVEGVRVLDWVSFNESGIKEEKGEWQKIGTSGNIWGRYDYLLGEEIEDLIVGKASDIKVKASGFDNGKGNLIKWSDSFKPTITLTLDK